MKDEHATSRTTAAEAAFRKWEGEWIDNWDGVEPLPDRLAIFLAGWDAAFAKFMEDAPNVR